MSDRPHPTPADLAGWHTGRLLTAAARLIEYAFDHDIADLGITHAGVRILDVLAAGPLPQHELALRCQVQDQTMSRTLEGLERGGLVIRHRDPADRRRLLVERTPEGASTMAHARQVAATRLPLDESADDAEDVAATRRVLIQISWSKSRSSPQADHPNAAAPRRANSAARASI